MNTTDTAEMTKKALVEEAIQSGSPLSRSKLTKMHKSSVEMIVVAQRIAAADAAEKAAAEAPTAESTSDSKPRSKRPYKATWTDKDSGETKSATWASYENAETWMVNHAEDGWTIVVSREVAA